MKGFPPELIYVLLFVGMLLVQYMLKRRRSQEPQESSPDGGVVQPRAEMSPDFAGLEQDNSIAWGASRVAADRLPRPEAPPALRARPRHRFSRQSLMGTRRDVQNAVVIATILGPCRALEPPGGAPAPASPRGTAR